MTRKVYGQHKTNMTHDHYGNNSTLCESLRNDEYRNATYVVSVRVLDVEVLVIVLRRPELAGCSHLGHQLPVAVAKHSGLGPELLRSFRSSLLGRGLVEDSGSVLISLVTELRVLEVGTHFRYAQRTISGPFTHCTVETVTAGLLLTWVQLACARVSCN